MSEVEKEQARRPWGRWVLAGVFGCLGLATLAAVPPACVGYLALRHRADADAVEKAEQVVDEFVRDARRDPRVTRVLGQPVRARRRMLSTNFDLSGGEVDAFVELKGPDGEGELHLHMRRVYGKWRVEEVRFEEMRSHAIDLLEDPDYDSGSSSSGGPRTPGSPGSEQPR